MITGDLKRVARVTYSAGSGRRTVCYADNARVFSAVCNQALAEDREWIGLAHLRRERGRRGTGRDVDVGQRGVAGRVDDLAAPAL